MSRLSKAVKVVGPAGKGWNDYEKIDGEWYEVGGHGYQELVDEDFVLDWVDNEGFTIVEEDEE